MMDQFHWLFELQDPDISQCCRHGGHLNKAVVNATSNTCAFATITTVHAIISAWIFIIFFHATIE